MTRITDAREIARALVEEHVRGLDDHSLTCDIDAEISEATVNVIFPGDEVCPACGGTGQPSEDDGTPKDFPQRENVQALLAEHRASALSDDDLTDKIMELFGAVPEK